MELWRDAGEGKSEKERGGVDWLHGWGGGNAPGETHSFIEI
jgi:hypothetical protein